MLSERARVNRHKLKYKIIHKKSVFFFTVRVRQWHRLPKEAVQSPCLEIPSGLFLLILLWAKVWTEEFPGVPSLLCDGDPRRLQCQFHGRIKKLNSFINSIPLVGWTGAPFRYVLPLVISNNEQLNPRKFLFKIFHKTVFLLLYRGQKIVQDNRSPA